MDVKDYLVMAVFSGIWIATTVFVFLHPEHFVAYCTLCGTMLGGYKWLDIHDDKSPDSQ